MPRTKGAKNKQPIKNVGLYIKLTQQEKELLKKASLLAGMSMSQYVLSKTIK
jgi:uncharacterized protein (DUF1778 family)